MNVWQGQARVGLATEAATNIVGPQWTPLQILAPSISRDWEDVVWLPAPFSWFVAVSSNGVGQRAATSPTGLDGTWTLRNTAADNSWNGLAFAPTLGVSGRLCAVAMSGAGNRVMTSDDGGVTWTIRVSAADQSWVRVRWCSGFNAGAGLFVAVSATVGVQAQRVMTSPDGIVWTMQNTPAPNGSEYVGLDYSVTLNRAIAAAYTGGAQVISSDDGLTWTARSTTIDRGWQGALWFPAGNLWIVMGTTGADRCVTSPSGLGGTWTQRAGLPANTWARATVATGPLAIVFANSGVGDRCATTPDGIVWTRRTLPDASWTGAAYSSTLNRVVAVGATGRISTSG